MIILGLGSNVGDRGANLQAAVKKLATLLEGMRISRVYESAALLPPGAPAEWDIPFLNMAVAGTTTLEPSVLLDEVKAIEAGLGRVSRGVWGPREIDIDILAMGDTVWNCPRLNVPHPKIISRDFVLLPVSDVAPGWRYPVEGEFFGKTAVQIAAAKGFVPNASLRDTGLSIHA